MKRIKNLNLPLLLTLLYICVGCTSNGFQMEKLSQIDSLLDKNPQAAYDSLCKDSAFMTSSGSTKVRMKYLMLQAKAANKLYYPMPSDSLFKEVVDYYDSKGSANEKMEAHYLLGCIYRDRHDAPMASQCYREAVDCADTLRQDCDYTTLFSIYGQIADIHNEEFLYDEAIEAYRRYGFYAKKAGDIYNYIRGKEFISGVLYSKGDTVNALKMTKECTELYKHHKMFKEAVCTYTTIIYTYLMRQDYVNAHIYMQKYEEQSGLFVGEEIEQGREYYNYLKGLYNLGISKIDSAEIDFREVLRFNYKYEAYTGLLSVYSTKLQVDSIQKYTLLSEKALDEIFAKNRANAVVQASSRYNYSRLQKENAKKELEAKELKLYMLIGTFVIVLIVICIYYRYRKNNLKKVQELEKKDLAYQQLQYTLNETTKDLKIAKEEASILIKKKENQIIALQEKILEIEKEQEALPLSEKKILLESNATYKKFKGVASGKVREVKLQESDWKDLAAMMKLYFPLFYSDITKRNILSVLEWQVCMLVRLQFKTKEILSLFDKTSSLVSNAKKSINNKLFGEARADSLYKNMLKNEL